MSVCTRKDGTVFVNWMEDGKKRRKYFGKGMQAMAEAVRYNDSIVNQGGRARRSGPLHPEDQPDDSTGAPQGDGGVEISSHR